MSFIKLLDPYIPRYIRALLMTSPHKSNRSKIAERGVESILYPNFIQTGETLPLVITRGDGIHVYDDAGNSYIEAMSGLWCTPLGFSENRLADAAYAQLQKLPYYHASAGKSNDVMVDLAEKLLSLSPSNMGKVHFANSGSEANEIAIKTIWYYNNALGRPQKKKIIGRRQAYHGLTVGSTSVTGIAYQHAGFDAPFDRFVHVSQPHYYQNALPGESEEDYATRCAIELEELILLEGPDTIAAMFMEPIMAAGGIVAPPKTYGPKVQEVLRRYDILAVSDEVICGFGRTGNYWGFETVKVKPDIITCAKAITSGYQPLSAIILSKDIVEAILAAVPEKGGFANGATYMGHPVSAAVALEALKIYDEIDIAKRGKALGKTLKMPFIVNFRITQTSETSEATASLELSSS